MIRWKLRTMMADRRMTNKELAQTLGVHPNTIHQLKDDYPTMIRLQHLDSLCKVLHCKPEDLFEMSYEEVTRATLNK